MKKTLRLIIGMTLLVLASGGLFAQGDQQGAAAVVDDGRQQAGPWSWIISVIVP
jgi:hypothetical protein